MGKLHADYPESLTLRLSTEQRVFLNDIAELAEATPSDFIRGLISNAQADHAINTIEEVLNAIDR